MDIQSKIVEILSQIQHAAPGVLDACRESWVAGSYAGLAIAVILLIAAAVFFVFSRREDGDWLVLVLPAILFLLLGLAVGVSCGKDLYRVKYGTIKCVADLIRHGGE